MTNEQKSAIEAMRGNGDSYAVIAKAIGLSRDTVKKHCQRHPVCVAADSPDGESSLVLCRQCHKKLPIIHGRMQPKFCSTECRRAWWKANPSAGNPKAFYTITCSGCGQSFTSYGNAGRKYCSHDCYIRSRFKGGDSHE